MRPTKKMAVLPAMGVFALVLLLLSPELLAQGLVDEEKYNDPRTSLVVLPDEWVKVLYTPGSLDRAARLQGRLRDLLRRLNGWSKTPYVLKVLVLSPREWAQLKPNHPYGFPLRQDDQTCVAPAWGTDESVHLWKGLVAKEDDGSGQFQVRGTPKEIASLALADLILELEICRGFMSSSQMAGGADEVWLNDLLGHVLCTTNDRLRAYQQPVGPATLLAALAVAEGAPESLPLDAYGADLDLGTWLGYQARFAQGSEEVWAASGKVSVKRILRMRRRKGSPLIFEDLLRLYPELEKWRRKSGIGS